MGIRQMKPFNPILGETYKGSFSEGTVITMEHISHHPPISYFYVTSGATASMAITNTSGSSQGTRYWWDRKGQCTLSSKTGKESHGACPRRSWVSTYGQQRLILRRELGVRRQAKPTEVQHYNGKKRQNLQKQKDVVQRRHQRIHIKIRLRYKQIDPKHKHTRRELDAESVSRLGGVVEH